VLSFVYDLLEKVGYTDPVHPPFVHFPIAAAGAALVFILVARALGRPVLRVSARHVFILGLAFWFPAVLAGYMDWQRYYAGAWLLPVEIKMILAGVLLVLFVIGFLLARRAQPPRGSLMLVYGLSFVNVVALGYLGGHLVFGSNTPLAPAAYRAGQKVFTTCSGCHPHGGNILYPNLTLRNAPQLESFEKFQKFIRNPEMPSGRKGPMPPFPLRRISEQQARELYDYIMHVIVKPNREAAG
jgi:mono/diheme cytochrome c family protein